MKENKVIPLSIAFGCLGIGATIGITITNRNYY